jgi:hypothetical protein
MIPTETKPSAMAMNASAPASKQSHVTSVIGYLSPGFKSFALDRHLPGRSYRRVRPGWGDELFGLVLIAGLATLTLLAGRRFYAAVRYR